jgi:cbb3-type cytochrome c oxidase subunit III
MKYLLPLLLLTLSLPLKADENQLLETLIRIRVDAAKMQKSINAGNARALLCKYCHGEDGNSVKTTIPNLAGQNTAYLIRQFEYFASGKRINKTMNQIAKILSPEDRVNIALYYSSQKVKPQKQYRPELLQKGKQAFESRCFVCHGHNGYGKKELPRIASQPADFLKGTLSSYTSTIVKRAETQMSAVARTLSKDDIEALTSYLTSLK